ncbi:galactosyltransferase-related protein [Niallia oryzisoli]|uniref:Galactosyltransferase-related protein n=1 Tax=Niallia oryzisoli TaxID=1737571 RepID=A0ABZ2CKN1_9BACI
MLEKVSIIIPFQTDNGPRAEAFKWIKQFYEHIMPEAELCLGIIDKSEINKSKAVNLAVKKATRDIFVIADADIVYDPKLIVKAVNMLELNKAPWVVPFNEIYEIEKTGTEKLLKTKPKWPIEVNPKECTKANWLYDGFAGKLIVIPRENFEAVEGFDERFIGWGGEDDAFSLSVQTICGNLANIGGKIYHVWHPPSNYGTNPHGKENLKLLNCYKLARGNKKKMVKLIAERRNGKEQIQLKNVEIFNKSENVYMKSPKSNICFAILVHEKKELVKQLIDNVRYFCPNSTIVLYNGGHDQTLCEGLGVPVCPSSRKLEYGYTSNYFLETMEWLEEMGIEYSYFINIDSDVLFYRKGYEEFIQSQMENTDYMGVNFRITDKYWHIGKEVMNDVDRWKKLFNVEPLYGVFNVGQVISRPLIKALLEPERKEKLKKSLLNTSSWGMDEVLFVNMAKELGFRQKKYPDPLDSRIIRYRPYMIPEEVAYYLITNSGFLCHPIIRDEADPVRKLICNIQKWGNLDLEQYKREEYPWYEDNPNNYSISLSIRNKLGNSELIVRSGSSLTNWQELDGKWHKMGTFADNVKGIPIFFETYSGDFVVMCKLITGEVGLWRRNNNTPGYHWFGQYIFRLNNITPLTGSLHSV